MRRTKPPAFTLLELLVVMAIIAVLTGLLLAAVQRVRYAAARMDCQNRLRQLALGLHLYHDVRHSLPRGHHAPSFANQQPWAGWTLSVLPFIEQEALARQAEADYRANANPFSPHVGLSIPVKAFQCPADGRVTMPQRAQRTGETIALTSYLGVAGQDAVRSRDGVLFQQSQVRLSDITDGTSNTLMLGERPPSPDFQFGWLYAGAGQLQTGSGDFVLGIVEENRQPIVTGSPCGPGRYFFRAAGGFADPCGVFHFWSPHLGGANFAFADGSVRYLSYDGRDLLPALASRAGGD